MTAGILPSARILRAAPLPNWVRASAPILFDAALLSSAMAVLFLTCLECRRCARRTDRKAVHRVDHGCRASLAEVRRPSLHAVGGRLFRPRDDRPGRRVVAGGREGEQ